MAGKGSDGKTSAAASVSTGSSGRTSTSGSSTVVPENARQTSGGRPSATPAALSDDDVDTMGLRDDDQPDAGGVLPDAAASVVSAITAPSQADDVAAAKEPTETPVEGDAKGVIKPGSGGGVKVKSDADVAFSLAKAETKKEAGASLKSPPKEGTAYAPEHEAGDDPSSSVTGSGYSTASRFGAGAATSSLGTSAAPSGLGTTATASTPGAHHVYPTGRDGQPVAPGTFVVVSDGNPDHPNHASAAEADAAAAETGEAGTGATLDAESSHIAHGAAGQDIAAEAYLVEEGEEAPTATVVKTYFGIERKRLYWIGGGAFVLLAIVLGTVLGVLLPQSNQPDDDVCGPLCGVHTPDDASDGGPVPDPDLAVLGSDTAQTTCGEWDEQSSSFPKPEEGTCEDLYLAAAYGCGCPGVEVPADSCGKLCSDGSDVPDPELWVRDINNDMKQCKDWELLAQFETDPDECVNYNVIGAMCGCPANEPHPDACGPLCGEGVKALHGGPHPVWNTACDDWNTLSTFLPRWYNNDAGETCEDYYRGPMYGCACPGVKAPTEPSCGTLCQQRRVCGPLCEDGSDVVDPSLVVKRDTCANWEQAAQLEVHVDLCPIYDVVGAMCGCENAPPADSCGGLCPGGSLPDPTKQIQGQTCEELDYTSRHLPGDYQFLFGDTGGGNEKACDEYFSPFAWGCDCPGVDPPTNGCGKLCRDGSSLPNPDKIVSGKTCRDQEINSIFETNPNQCAMYEIIGIQCDCPLEDEYDEACFEMKHLENRTYYWSAGNHAYLITFGENGVFAQVDNANNYFSLGHLSEIDGNVATYGGGAPCGVYGPRSGKVTIVEDPSTTKPTITDLNEPSICIYTVEMRVPTFCNNTSPET